jgi:hypothetical protein
MTPPSGKKCFMGLPPNSEVSDWLMRHGNMTQADLLNHLSHELPETPIFDEIHLRNPSELRFQVSGLSPNNTCVWTMSVDIVPDQTIARDRNIWIAIAGTEENIGRILLRNLVATTAFFGVTKICSHASSGRSFAYPQAGFLPNEGVMWNSLKERLRNHAYKLTEWQALPDEIKLSFEELFNSNSSISIREIVPSPIYGQIPPLMIHYSQLCKSLILSVDWEGELNLEDDISSARYWAYVADL